MRQSATSVQSSTTSWGHLVDKRGTVATETHITVSKCYTIIYKHWCLQPILFHHYKWVQQKNTHTSNLKFENIVLQIFLHVRTYVCILFFIDSRKNKNTTGCWYDKIQTGNLPYCQNALYICLCCIKGYNWCFSLEACVVKWPINPTLILWYR